MRSREKLLIALGGPVLCVLLGLVIVILVIRFRRPRRKTVAFFHPNCSNAGGGERVLWVALVALGKILTENSDLAFDVVIYSADDGLSQDRLLEKVKSRFQLEIPDVLSRKYLQIVKISTSCFLDHRYFLFKRVLFGSSDV